MKWKKEKFYNEKLNRKYKKIRKFRKKQQYR